ncbi:MAG: nicotinate-nucleotide--dimethylbenzimidazole phosphoribosyltransferase, partial [Coriobacteriales bacterium]|nr:nicotinate-nucleotide--dimethylbenzimidazole phosphoribosyltransferase [Coriobacteriales bacterium]
TFEALVARIASISGSESGFVDISKRLAFVLAADNGVTAQGISVTPAEITVSMASFMAQRRSSVCIMAREAKCDVELVDMGMFRKLEGPGIVDRHVADGTADISIGPAMSAAEAEQAVQAGIDLVRDAVDKGYRLIATGEMGIGNTTTSSAVATVLLGKTARELTGRGVGLDDEGLANKVRVIDRAIEVNKPDRGDPFGVLQKLGGFDIAGMCGIFIGGALYRVPVVIDGLISSVSALLAVRLCPKAVYALVPSHLSAEPAAMWIMDELGLSPIVHAGMRLGEGTGAITIIPLLDLIIAVMNDMMTLSDIGM